MGNLDYESLQMVNGGLVLGGVRCFDLSHTLGSGQCFRWVETGPCRWQGVVEGKLQVVEQCGDEIRLLDTTVEEFEAFWKPYFDLGRSYHGLFEHYREDGTLGKALDFAPGIRVLRQPPFEALCSFILSQNNHIARIKGLVQRLCEQFGEKLPCGGYAFPEPGVLAKLSVEDLSPVRAGFRAKYILDAAKKVDSGEVPLTPLYTMPLDEARQLLRTISGIGPKVAECVLLYGFGRVECFPVDTWIAKALQHLYPGGFPAGFSDTAGIAQQSLFHYVRCCKDALVAGA